MRLIVSPGLPDEQEFTLKSGPNSIGRARDNDIVILDQSLSRYHARIDATDERIQITDLQSRNGTWINGKRIQETNLHHGDSIKWGDVRCVVVVDTAAIAKEISGDLSEISLKDLVEKSHKSQSRDRLNIILKVSQLLSSPHALDKLMETILDLLFEIMSLDRAVIMLLNETGNLEPRYIKHATN